MAVFTRAASKTAARQKKLIKGAVLDLDALAIRHAPPRRAQQTCRAEPLRQIPLPNPDPGITQLTTRSAAAALKVGDVAPLVEGKTQDGKAWKLADALVHKVVLLYFHPKDDTPGCTKEACGLRDRMEDLKKDKVEVVG